MIYGMDTNQNIHNLAEELNKTLDGCIAGRFLSDLGKRIYFPKGIITQSAEAKKLGKNANATIGTAVNNGEPMMLSSIKKYMPGLTPAESVSYAPTEGNPALREMWKKFILEKNPSLTGKNFSLPVLVPGLTAGISFLSEILKNDNGADTFRAKAADVLLNYDFDTSYPDVAEIAEKILPDEKKRWLCYELGKSIAKIKNQRTSDLASLYLSSPDSLTQNLGLDMYERNRYPSLKSVIQELSENEKAGAVQRRAIKILENDTPSDSGSSSSSTPVNGKETSEGVKASPSTPSPSVSSPEDSPKPSGETYIESSGEAEELKTDAKETSSEVTDFTSASFDENLWAD